MKLPVSILVADLLTGSSTVSAMTLSVGDIVAMEDGAINQIVKFDPDTGAKTTICPTTLFSTQDLAVSHTGEIYLAGTFFAGGLAPSIAAIVGIDPESCLERTILIDEAAFPSGSLGSIAVEANGSILVTNIFDLSIERVNPSSGAHSIVTQDVEIAGSLKGVDVGPDGDIYVVASTAPAFLAGVVRIDPTTGQQTRVTFSPGGNNDEIISPKDIVVGSDGRIFVYDVRFRGSGLERELRIIEVDSLNGVQTMRNDAGVGTDDGFSNYRGIGISNTGRIVYFVDFSTSPGGNSGVSSVDLDGPLNTNGQFFRNKVNASGTTLSQAGSGLDVVPLPPPNSIFSDGFESLQTP